MIVNLTPHPLTLVTDEGNEVVEPTLPPARVKTVGGPASVVEGLAIPVGPVVEFGEIENLPAEKDGVWYVVSGIVGAAVQNRADVLVPGTGPTDNPVRDEKGRIAAVTRLNRTC